MRPSELFKFTCQCLLLPARKIWSDGDEYPELKEYIREKFVSGEVDLDQFINLCSNHLVLPAITLKLQKHGLLELFPAEYSNHLLEILELNQKRNKEILQQINEINSALEKENILPLYLKGTANLLDNLYSDSGERMIGDIDFLVKEKDYLKTVDVIFKLGYKNDATVYDDPKTSKHYPRLYKEEVPADIEIHRIPVAKTHLKQFNSELLFKNKKNIENNSFVSSNEHKVIHTFIHSQLNDKGFQNRIIRLRDLYDAYLLSKRVNPDVVLTQIEEKKKARMFFEYVGYLFNPGQKNTISKEHVPNKFVAQHIWFLNHPGWHRLYIRFFDLYELIVIRYFLRIIKALFQKSSFNHIYNRIKDPQWYNLHFSSIKKIFFPKSS